MAGIGEKARSAFSGATDKIKINNIIMEGIGEKVSEVSGKLKGTVKRVPVISDELSNNIDQFLEERKDQIIKDWELESKNDVLDPEKRYKELTTDMGESGTSFSQQRANNRVKDIEERLNKLEIPEK